MARIGFVGLGRMGAHMARNLLKAGHEVVVFDIVQAAVDSVVASGAKAAFSSSPFSRSGVRTGRPSASARRCTGEGVRRPRFAGRGGCV